MDPRVMNEFRPRTFWEKVEGKVGAAGLIGLAGGFTYLTASNADKIMEAMKSPLHAVFIGGSLLTVSWMLFDKRIRRMIVSGYKSFSRWLTGLFVTIDPIGILRNYLDDLRKKESEVNGQIGNLKGELGKIQKTIKENQDIIEKSKKRAAAAQQSGASKQVMLAVRKAGRKQNFNKSLEEVQERMSKLYEVLKKISENINFFIEDLEDEIDTRESEYKAIKAGHTAIKGAMGVFADASQEELFQQAMDFVIEDTGRKLGEIDYFLDASEKFIAGIDIENQVFEMEGLEMIEEWERNQGSYIMGSTEKDQLMHGVSADSIKSTLQKEQKNTYAEILNEYNRVRN